MANSPFITIYKLKIYLNTFKKAKILLIGTITINNKKDDANVFYCENCGYELFKHDKKCNFCGKVIDKTTKKELDD